MSASMSINIRVSGYHISLFTPVEPAILASCGNIEDNSFGKVLLHLGPGSHCPCHHAGQFHVTLQTAYYTFKVKIRLEANNRVPVIWWHVSYYIIFGWCNLRQSPSSYHSGWICILCVITSYVLNSCPSVMPTSQWQYMYVEIDRMLLKVCVYCLFLSISSEVSSWKERNTSSVSNVCSFWSESCLRFPSGTFFLVVDWVVWWWWHLYDFYAHQLLLLQRRTCLWCLDCFFHYIIHYLVFSCFSVYPPSFRLGEAWWQLHLIIMGYEQIKHLFLLLSP